MTLQEEQRIAIFYADVEGLSYKEIALVMGTSVGTVMSRLHRGRHRLRTALVAVSADHGRIPRLDAG
jgi:RNA polymerase sigma-70 factor (ECF subfamily)